MAGDMLFYLLAFLILAFSFLTVTLKNLLHAALALMSALFSTAALFLLLRAEFVALAQVMVYIGGIVIFIVYAILLTSRLGERFDSPSKLKVVSACLVSSGCLWFLLEFLHSVPGLHSPPQNAGVPIAALKGVGVRLLSTGPEGFLIPFELVSILLLAALIGAITIARGGPSIDDPGKMLKEADALSLMDAGRKST